jgi:hypothetical protein
MSDDTDDAEIEALFRLEAVRLAAASCLRELMAAISQDYWCAGWLGGIEFDLWSTVMGLPPGTKISEREKTLLRLLSEECEGWWTWSDSARGLKFVPLAEWQEIVRSREADAPS